MIRNGFVVSPGFELIRKGVGPLGRTPIPRAVQSFTMERIAAAASMSPAPVQRLALLIELVHVDLLFRLRAGEPAQVESYLERYPELRLERGVVTALLAVASFGAMGMTAGAMQ